MARLLLLIRHAEEPSHRDQGVDEHGRPDADGLSVRGWQRAGALVRWLAPLDGRFAHEGLSRPEAIFAARDAGKSRRPELTARPLADALERAPDLRFGSEGDARVAAQAALALSGPVLFVWRHQALPALASALAGPGVAPAVWRSDCYDRLWLLRRDGERWTFIDLPQRLLCGDATA